MKDNKFLHIGTRIKRVDALQKVTGQAKYYSDEKLPDTLVGKILTSPYPHAKIVSIDTSKAEKLEGVKSIVTGKDMPEMPIDFYQIAAAGHSGNLALALNRVRFIGEEVAAVAADNENIADEALKLIDVKYEVLDAVSLTMEKEGLIPALESAHAFARAFKEASDLSDHDIIIINQSGRGDKDIFTIADAFADAGWQAFIQRKGEEYGP